MIDDFCTWYAVYHGLEADKGAFLTCICGYFHTFPKRATAILAEMKAAGLVKVKTNRVYLQPHNDP